MKALSNRILENLIWIRENMIAKGKDVRKINEDIDRVRAEIAAKLVAEEIKPQ